MIEMEDRMVPRMMNQSSGGLIKKWCEGKGVTVLTSTKVNAITQGANGELGVNLGMGDTRPADLVIAATGVKPNTSFLKGSTDVLRPPTRSTAWRLFTRAAST